MNPALLHTWQLTWSWPEKRSPFTARTVKVLRHRGHKLGLSAVSSISRIAPVSAREKVTGVSNLPRMTRLQPSLPVRESTIARGGGPDLRRVTAALLGVGRARKAHPGSFC